jgi:queuine tRNA-ribosyltransferase
MAGEMAARTLNTLHNLSFYLDTMRRIRDAIAFQSFATFRQEFLRLGRNEASGLPYDP